MHDARLEALGWSMISVLTRTRGRQQRMGKAAVADVVQGSCMQAAAVAASTAACLNEYCMHACRSCGWMAEMGGYMRYNVDCAGGG